jgi:uncharacterized membrane protein
MVRYYIFLACSCAAVGIVITFLVLLIARRLNIDFTGDDIWVLAIPVFLSVALNIILIEIFQKFRKKKK